MQKFLSLVLALTATAAFAAEPQTPAPTAPANVDPAAALLKSAEAAMNDELSQALARRQNAADALAKAAKAKAEADTEVDGLEEKAKNATATRNALKKIIDEQLTDELQKVTAAADAQGKARADLAALPATASSLVVGVAKKKVAEANDALIAAKKAFKEFATAAGVDVPDDVDPLLAQDPFNEKMKELEKAVADLETPLAEAKEKAKAAAEATTAAQAELTSAIVALREPAYRTVLLARLGQPVQLPTDVVAAITGQKTALDQIAAKIDTLSTSVGGLTTEVKGLRADLTTKLDGLKSALDALKTPDLSALADALKTALAGSKFSDEQIKLVMANITKLTAAAEAISKKPDPDLGGLERIRALLESWKVAPMEEVFQETVCENGYQVNKFFVVRNGEKVYIRTK